MQGRTHGARERSKFDRADPRFPDRRCRSRVARETKELLMRARRSGPVLALAICALALSCRAQPTVVPRAADAVALVSPDTGPSALQLRLAALAPAHAAASGELDARIDGFFARLASRRGYLAVDKPMYQPGETIWFRLFDLASADLDGGAPAVATVK